MMSRGVLFKVLLIIIIAFFSTEITVSKMTIIIVRMMGYICTEAREPAATKENEHIKRSLHKII